MNHNKLTLPAQCTILSEDELSTIEGGGIISQVLYAFGRMFRSTHVGTWSDQGGSNEWGSGSVVSEGSGVYTESVGGTQYGSQGWSINGTLGDFFYGLGDLFYAFGL